MKKSILILSVLLVATFSHAASIAWTASGLKFGETSLANAATVSANLIYLGAGGSLASSYTVDTLTSMIVASSSGVTGKGVNTGSYTLTVGSDKNGDAYGFLLSYENGGKTYYNLSTLTYTLSGFSDAGSVIDKWTVAAASQNYATTTTAESISAGGGWIAATPVPEPATGALALAGIALLFKRRKARA